MDLLLQPGSTVGGQCQVPGDKSISHRALLFAGLASGTSHITGLLEGADVLATAAALRAVGVQVERLGLGHYRVEGCRPWTQPVHPIDCGNSGTTMRLLLGLLAAQGLAATLVGDVSLSRRPMLRVIEPLSEMGARFQATEGHAPVSILASTQPLLGQEHRLKVASAQVKTALLLAGLFAHGTTTVIEQAPTRDHTENMLRAFGVEVHSEGLRISLSGGQRLQPVAQLPVPGDISSAVFFVVAGLLGQRPVRLTQVGINPRRSGALEVLRAMGGRLELENQGHLGGEPVADIVAYPSALTGTVVPPQLAPSAIDEFPALFVAAACARGRSHFSGLEELRVKESDRIEAMASGLSTLGVKLNTFADGIAIEGREHFGGGDIDSHHDHRIAMSFAVAAIRATEPMRVRGADNIHTSFPGFVAAAQSLGLRVSSL